MAKRYTVNVNSATYPQLNTFRKMRSLQEAYRYARPYLGNTAYDDVNIIDEETGEVMYSLDLTVINKNETRWDIYKTNEILKLEGLL